MAFRDVIGHRRLVSLLARSVERGSVPPSLIFAGPSGVGKRLTATALAQAVNCLQPFRAPITSDPDTRARELVPSLDYDACGTCPTCLRIARGIHPDVLGVEPGESGSIKIDPIREVVDRTTFRPFEGRRRVVIIDEADALVPAAQNALLKTLEEPPSASMIILVTARPDALLPTVRSRCPRLRFRPLGPEEVASALVNRGRSDAEARAIAATADGSISGALDASAQHLVAAREVAARVLTHAAATNDPQRRIEAARDLLTTTGGSAADREQLATYLRAMASLLRDVELLAAGADRGRVANADMEASFGRLGSYRGERGVRAFEAIDRAIVALDCNAGVKLVADWVVLNV